MTSLALIRRAMQGAVQDTRVATEDVVKQIEGQCRAANAQAEMTNGTALIVQRILAQGNQYNSQNIGRKLYLEDIDKALADIKTLLGDPSVTTAVRSDDALKDQDLVELSSGEVKAFFAYPPRIGQRWNITVDSGGASKKFVISNMPMKDILRGLPSSARTLLLPQQSR